MTTAQRTTAARWWSYGFCGSNVLSDLMAARWSWLSFWLAWIIALAVLNALVDRFGPTPGSPEGT